jgi:hypothetical protein
MAGFLPWILAVVAGHLLALGCASTTEVYPSDEDAGDGCSFCCPGCSCACGGGAGSSSGVIESEDAGFSVPPTQGSPAGVLGSSCVTSIDCGGGLVCGYEANAGCNAPGSCVQEPSGAPGPTACGCDGLPVQYVAPTYTSVPVASPLPCGDEAGVDAGVDAGDTNVDDASSDGETAADAEDGASIDP